MSEVEARYGIAFGPDHRDLLMQAVPQGAKWIDWAHGDEEPIRARLAWPREGLLFDVEQNSFWPPHWGPRPGTPQLALAEAGRRLEMVPLLIPVYAHRFMLAAPAPSSCRCSRSIGAMSFATGQTSSTTSSESSPTG